MNKEGGKDKVVVKLRGMYYSVSRDRLTKNMNTWNERARTFKIRPGGPVTPCDFLAVANTVLEENLEKSVKTSS